MKKLMPMILLLGVVLTLTLSSTPSSTPPVWAQAAPRTIDITAKRFTYDPDEITLKKGQPVVLVLRSLDVSHGLRIRELNVEVKIPKGGTAEARFTPEKTGDFVGHCAVFCGAGHGSMMLKLHVVD